MSCVDVETCGLQGFPKLTLVLVVLTVVGTLLCEGQMRPLFIQLGMSLPHTINTPGLGKQLLVTFVANLLLLP
jgi:hypothetical protein